jgi:hypothetical protein
MTRLVIEAFTLPDARNHPVFATALEAARSLTEVFIQGAEGEAKAYLDEQVNVLRLIKTETTPAPA